MARLQSSSVQAGLDNPALEFVHFSGRSSGIETAVGGI